MSETLEELGLTKRDVDALRSLRRSPNMLTWNWQFPSGATLKAEMIGRWTEADAEQAKTLLDMIAGIIKDGVDPVSQEPAP